MPRDKLPREKRSAYSKKSQGDKAPADETDFRNRPINNLDTLNYT